MVYFISSLSTLIIQIVCFGIRDTPGTRRSILLSFFTIQHFIASSLLGPLLYYLELLYDSIILTLLSIDSSIVSHDSISIPTTLLISCYSAWLFLLYHITDHQIIWQNSCNSLSALSLSRSLSLQLKHKLSLSRVIRKNWLTALEFCFFYDIHIHLLLVTQ